MKMARNEKTGKKIASIASRLLREGKGKKKDIKAVAASALTQAPDRRKKKKKSKKK